MHFTTGAVALWCLSVNTNAFSTNCKHILTFRITPLLEASKTVFWLILDGCEERVLYELYE